MYNYSRTDTAVRKGKHIPAVPKKTIRMRYALAVSRGRVHGALHSLHGPRSKLSRPRMTARQSYLPDMLRRTRRSLSSAMSYIFLRCS